MSQLLEYYEEAYERLKTLQTMNAGLNTAIKETARDFHKIGLMTLSPALHRIDDVLAKKLEEIGEAYERTKAELKAAESNQKDSFAASEESFNGFINDCIAQFEARDDLMDSGDSFWLDFHKEGRNGTRSVSVIIKEER